MVDNFVDYLQNVGTGYNNLEYFGYIEDNAIVNIFLMRFVGIVVDLDDYLDNYYL